MPKMKTHKGAKRRFKVTGTGKVLQQQSIRGNKRRRPKRSQRRYGKDLPSSPSNRSHFEVALPYGLD
jgi:large subunit ribosomal protein L35